MPNMKQCVSCQQWIPAKAAGCPHCQTPQPKKRSYAPLVIAIAAVLAIGSVVYYFEKKPKKSDNLAKKLSLSEDAVAFTDYYPSFVDYDVNTDSFGDARFYGFYKIYNTGTSNLYLSGCDFEINDYSGHLLKTISHIESCPEIIAPKEYGYFYSPCNGVSLESCPKDCKLDIVTYDKVKKVDSEPVNYEVYDTEIKEDNTATVVVTGRVKNTSNATAKYVKVHCVFFDKDSHPFAIEEVSVFDIPAGESKSFEMSNRLNNDNLKLNNIKDYKFYAQEEYI